MTVPRYEWACSTCNGRRLKLHPPEYLKCQRCGAIKARPPMGRLPAPVELFVHRFFGRGAVLDYRYLLGYTVMGLMLVGVYFRIQYIAEHPHRLTYRTPAVARVRNEQRGRFPSEAEIEWAAAYARRVQCRSFRNEAVQDPPESAGLCVYGDPDYARYVVASYPAGEIIEPTASYPEDGVWQYEDMAFGFYNVNVVDALGETVVDSVLVNIYHDNHGRRWVDCEFSGQPRFSWRDMCLFCRLGLDGKER